MSSVLATLADSAVQYGMQTARDERNNERYRDNVFLNNRLSLENQRQSASNVVAGFKMAGLSPALASQGNFSPVATPSAPMQSGEVPKPSVMEALASQAQVRLMEAEARKAEADADDKEIDVKRKGDEDSTWNLNLRAYFEGLAKNASSPSERDFYTRMSRVPATKGSADGLSAFFDLKSKGYKVRADIIADKIRAYVEDFRLSQVRKQDVDNPFFYAIMSAPQKEAEKIIKEISYLMAQTDYMKSMKSLTDKDFELTKEEIEQIKAMTEHIKNTDIKQLADKGDWKGVFIAVACLVLEGFAGRGASFIGRSHSSSVVQKK